MEKIKLSEQRLSEQDNAKELLLPTDGIVAIPSYDSSGREKRKLTAVICQQIDSYLQLNAEKRRAGMAKQQMKGTDIYEALQERGYEISYTSVCRYIRTQENKSKEVYIRQKYNAGASVEFDWAEVKLNIGGLRLKLMLAVFTSSYSNHRWARLYYRQDMSSFLDAHSQYFSYTGYVQQEVVYDNMRVAVSRLAWRNKDKVPSDDLLRLSTYYQYDYRFCNVAKGNEKGHVEKSVEYVRRKAFCRQDDFENLASANTHLLQKCEVLNAAKSKGCEQSIVRLFEAECKVMHPAPPAYDPSVLQHLRVDKYSCIKVDTNWYSIKEGCVGKVVLCKTYPDKIRVYSIENKLLAEH